MALTGFDTYYSDHPWAGMTTNQRDYYVPDLLGVFRARSIYRPFVPISVDLAAQRTGTMIFTILHDLEPNTNALNNRDLWLESMHWDTARVQVTMEHHGTKVAYHKYDDIITYWRQNNREGLRRICRGALGQAMTDHLDILARNAFLQSPYRMTTDAASASGGFDGMVSTNLFNLEDIMDIWLGLSYREVPMANNPAGQPDGTMICITSPGVIYDIQTEASTEWVNVNNYSEAGRSARLRNEVGMYKSARFLKTSRNTLWNAGPMTKQVTVTTSTVAGVGASATVDTVYTVGQSGATAYVQCSPFTADDFEVNDIVTIHAARTSDWGVNEGVDWTDGQTCVRRLTAVDADNNRLSFDKPLLQDYDVLLDTDVYAYITKGLHVHGTVCLGGPEGVVAGVAQPPMVHNPPMVEDIPSMHRFSWDGYLKYQSFRPEVVEVIFSAGNIRVKGTKSTG